MKRFNPNDLTKTDMSKFTDRKMNDQIIKWNLRDFTVGMNYIQTHKLNGIIKKSESLGVKR